MDVEALRSSPNGRLVTIHGTDARRGTHYDHYAYVPEPLPDELALTQQSWCAASSAMEALGRLHQACSQLPNPRLLIVPALTKEALATSALEGTYSTLPEVLEARLPHFATSSPEVREIVAYERMAELAFEWVTDRPITVAMLCDLQRILSEGSRTPAGRPGEVRQHQVVIGPENCTVQEARFIPPPEGDLLRAGLDDWQRWVNADHDLPVIVRAALAHYQFECLHPFADGNGRVGRLVVLLQLLRAGALAAPALTISPWLLRRRRDYHDVLLDTSKTGDWNPLVRFFAAAVEEQAAAHLSVAQHLLDWITDVRRRIIERRWSGAVALVAEDLIDWPVITARFVQDKYAVSGPTAKSVIDRLVELGVLTELSGRKYNRTFGAREVMRAVDTL